MSDFQLTPSERGSPLWVRLTEHLKARLEVERTRNDGPRDVAETAHTRGKIAQLREILKFGVEPE